jgi:hypothetical protein
MPPAAENPAARKNYSENMAVWLILMYTRTRIYGNMLGTRDLGESLMKANVVLGAGLMASALLGLTLAGCGPSAADSGGEAVAAAESRITPAGSPAPVQSTGKGMAAIRQAAEAGKYLFIFFSKSDDEQTVAMRKVYDKAMEKVADRAQGVVVNITDASEKAVVDKFDLRRAPLPLVLAMAPNGAITGGFPTKFDQQQLLDAFASPGTEKVMKPLQDGKLVFVCVQNDKTKSNDAALQGVREFQADTRFAHAAEIISLDPADKQEAGFLADLQVASDTTEAVTVFLAPPGKPIAKYEGATNKEALVDALGKANTGCGPGGCGPGGCGPAK